MENGYWKHQTSVLMETGGKSPWGHADVGGSIMAVKKSVGGGNFKTTYSIRLADSTGHGLNYNELILDEYEDDVYMCRLIQ